MLVRISARQSVLCRLPGSSCTDAAQPLGWPHTERQSSADSSMYRRVEYCETAKLWILSSMTPRRGIVGPVEVLSWQPQLPVKCRPRSRHNTLAGRVPTASDQVFQAVHRTRPPPRTTPGGDQVMRAKPSAAPHVPIGKAVGKAGLVLPEDVLLVLRITRPPRLLAATT